MLERKIRVTRNNPEDSAPIPAEAKAWIEGERTVDQRDRHVAVLAEDPEDECSNRNHFRILGLSLQGAARARSTAEPRCISTSPAP